MKKGYLQSALTFFLILCMLGFLASCGPGGGSGNIDDPNGTEEPSSDDSSTAANAKKISLATSQVSVKSDNSDSATITATVLDKDNAVLEGATVSFSADGGQISAASVDTDESGRAQIVFSSGTIEKSNRVVTITAKVGNLSAVQIPISVSGTAISLATGKTNLELDPESPDKAKATLTITVKDAGVQPIYDAEVTVSLDPTSTGDATVTPLAGYEDHKTDLSGQIKVEVTGTEAGTVVVKAAALGAMATQTYTVGGVGEVFSIIDPADDVVSLSTNEPLTITVAAPDFSDYSVAFATTLGAWDGGSEQVVIKAREDGQASAVLRSAEAGLATVQVYREDDISRTDSITVAISAPSSEAAKIALQASATVVQPSTEGVNNTVTLIATVKNTSDQVVGGAPVAFSIEDTTGGGEFVAPVVVLTNSSGRAESTFTSGSLSSDAAGVKVTARVVGSPGVEPSSIAIVIGGTAGSIGIGRATVVASISDDTAYSLPMSVLVSDTNGNAVPGAEVSLKIWPLNYATGFWVPQSPPSSDCVPVFSSISTNEDKNRNLILDPGEDVNKDGKLTPHSSAAGSLPSVVVTDENGVANFDLVYLKVYAAWINAEITASTFVQGTETQASYIFTLPWLKSDSSNCFLPDSPYNTPPEVELLVEAVPTVIAANGSSTSEIRVLARDSKHNPIIAEDVYFSTDLGTISSVAITDTEGYATLGTDGNGNRVWPTLTSEKQNGIANITVNFNDTDKTVQVAFTGVSISVTANPESLPTDSSATITATLKDAAGDPLAGQQIILTTTSPGSFTPGPGGGTVSDGEFTAITNTEGRVTALLTRSTSGIAEVTAYHGPTKGTAVETKATTQVSFSGVQLTITPEVPSLVADGVSATNVEFELKNEGLPIADQTLILSTTLGTIDYTVTTNIEGKANATLTAGNVVGVATITATANLGAGNIIGGSIPFNMTSGIVDSIDILVDPPVISVNTGTSDISVAVRDANGNPVGGVQVAFSIVSGPGGGETITPARITTPGPGSPTPGQVTSVFKAGSLGSTVPKDVVIQVRAGDEGSSETATANLTIVGKPAHIALGICTVFGQCVVNNGDGTFSMPAAAVVSDVNGIGVPAGYLVYFSTDTPDVGALISPVATDDTGKASTTFIFPQTALGTLLTITAETTGISQSFSFEIPFEDDEIANVTLSVPANIRADGVEQVLVNAVAMQGDGDFSDGVSFFETNQSADFTGNPVGAITGTTYVLFGETIAQFTADPSSSDYIVWMRARSADVLSEVKPIQAKGVTVALEADTNTLMADGVSSTTLTARVKETTSGRPVAFAAIEFGTSLGTVSGSAFTDESGTATATFTSALSSVDRIATVSVYYGPNLTDSVQIELAAYVEPPSGTVGKVDLLLGQESLVADGENSTLVTATVTDLQQKSVVDGTVVIFKTTGGSFVGASPDPTSYTATTVGGEASAVLQASTMPGQYVVTATSGGISKLISIEFVPGVPADIILTANPYVIKPSPLEPNTSSITAVVVDENNNIVLDDTPVTFRTTVGNLTDPTKFGDLPLPIKTVLTFQGVAPVVLHSSNDNDLAVVTAQVNGILRSVNVVIGIGPGTGEPVFIEITAEPESIQVKGTGGDESAWIQAAVRDAQGFPYQDAGIDDPKKNIQFEILTGPGGGEVLDAGTGDPLDGRGQIVKTSTTDGIAWVALNSGTIPGTVRIKVSVLKDTQGNSLGTPVQAISTPIGIEAGGPYSITIYKDEAITNNADGTYSWTISAMVRDQYGNPVSDETGVYFGLVDNPIYGYKSAGADGAATEGSNVFTSATTDFLNDGVEAMDTLIILEGQNEGGYVIDHVIDDPGNHSVNLFYNLSETESNLDFVAGNAERGEICGYGETGGQIPNVLCVPALAPAIKGVARSRLTWSLDARGFPFCIYAETAGRDLGDTLCDVYRSIEDVKIDVVTIPDGVIPYYMTDGITIQAHFYDAAGNDLVDRTLTFRTSNTAVTGFDAVGTATTTAVTNLNGRATVENLRVADCRQSGSTTITVSSGDTLSTEVILSVEGNLPEAAFTQSQSSGLSVQFEDNSSTTVGTITGWSWDFGDSSAGSSEQNPTHDFPSPGVYTVTLTATNSLGCDSSPYSKSVSVQIAPPTADFIDNDEGNADEVSFIDNSSTPAGTTLTQWNWTFVGGSPGTFSGQVPPVISFGGAGTYPVMLTVTNDVGGTDTTNVLVTVDPVTPTVPTAGFIYDDQGNGDEVAFIDNSSTPAGTTLTQRDWTFVGGSPGTFSGQFPPMISFGGAGTYPVSLTVTNNTGGTDTFSAFVNVAPAPVPTANFNYVDKGDSDHVAFVDNSTTPAGTTLTQWEWTFVSGSPNTWSGQVPPEISFGSPNTYAVSLKVTNNVGGIDTYSGFVTVP